MKTKLLFAALLIVTAFQTEAQYKRRGETLTNPRNNTQVANVNKPASGINPDFLLGKWQEVKRINRKTNSVQEFTDSTQLYFVDSGNVQIKEGRGVRMDADYHISTDQLFLSIQDFTIKSLAENKLVLDDKDDWIKEFIKVPFFTYESNGKKVAQIHTTDSLLKPDINKLRGSWYVSSRRAIPGIVDSDEFLFRSLNIKDIQNNAASVNAVYYNRDTTISATGKITALPNSLLIEMPGFTREVYLFSENGSELIFGNKDHLLYYCKLIKNQYSAF